MCGNNESKDWSVYLTISPSVNLIDSTINIIAPSLDNRQTNKKENKNDKNDNITNINNNNNNNNINEMCFTSMIMDDVFVEGVNNGMPIQFAFDGTRLRSNTLWDKQEYHHLIPAHLSSLSTTTTTTLSPSTSTLTSSSVSVAEAAAAAGVCDDQPKLLHSSMGLQLQHVNGVQWGYRIDPLWLNPKQWHYLGVI
jgi:hypothetical protein